MDTIATFLTFLSAILEPLISTTCSTATWMVKISLNKSWFGISLGLACYTDVTSGKYWGSVVECSCSLQNINSRAEHYLKHVKYYMDLKINIHQTFSLWQFNNIYIFNVFTLDIFTNWNGIWCHECEQWAYYTDTGDLLPFEGRPRGV